MDFSYYGIDHVQLAAPAGTESIARKFFHGVLGMKEIDKPESLKKRGGVWFQCGKNQIHIGIDNDFKPARKAHPAINVKNLDALKDKLISCGIKVKYDEQLPDSKRFYVDDPFGNRLEFIERD
ncbi:MAG: VOC family protein [Nitrososphaeria archaeon]